MSYHSKINNKKKCFFNADYNFLALMLSAFKFQSIAYCPSSIKRVLANTAAPLGQHDPLSVGYDPFSVGYGIIQVSSPISSGRVRIINDLTFLFGEATLLQSAVVEL